MNKILAQDAEVVLNSSSIDFSVLEGKTILVTGATGLIGFNLVTALLSSEYDISVLAFVRNLDKAEKMYGNVNDRRLKFAVGDVTRTINIDRSIDYIVHAACQTSSKSFVNEPVETILTAIRGTKNMLELAKEKKVSSFVYLSTMEVYGAPSTDEKISEDHGTDLNTMSVRTSYPESKRACEMLCKAYQAEYGVPSKVATLTQTFGPGVQYDDGRVFAEFARCAIEKRNIVLHTKGETKRNYLYTADAVTAILTILLKGKDGEAYNAANEDTYCSIFEMAKMVAEKCAGGEIEVVIEEKDEDQFGYAPVLKMNLDASKLKSLGWEPKIGLEDMFQNLIVDMQVNRNESRND